MSAETELLKIVGNKAACSALTLMPIFDQLEPAALPASMFVRLGLGKSKVVPHARQAGAKLAKGKRAAHRLTVARHEKNFPTGASRKGKRDPAVT